MELALTDLILCEILRGAKRRSEFDAIRADLMDYRIFDTGGEDIAVAAAENYRELRSRGSTIRTLPDCIIATFCILNGHALLHRDRDFDAFEKHLGLRCLHV